MTPPASGRILGPQLWPEQRWRPLAERLIGAPPATLRRIAVSGAHLAVERTAAESETLGDALRAADAGAVGDGPVRDQVQAVADSYDGVGFDARERADAGEHAAAAEYDEAFRRARAAQAVWFALSGDPVDAAEGSLYEARHALDDDAALQELIERQLDGDSH